MILYDIIDSTQNTFLYIYNPKKRKQLFHGKDFLVDIWFTVG